jgi:hypothetical protein
MNFVCDLVDKLDFRRCSAEFRFCILTVVNIKVIFP